MRWRGVACAVLMAIAVAAPAHAVEQQNKGLFITPARDYITATPGKTTHHQVTLANNTATPLDITFSVEQFSVADYTYDFTFTPTKDNWITFDTAQAAIAPGKSFVLGYVLAAPANASPGGHYFTLLATASIDAGGLKSKVQAATTLYVTMQGPLAITSSLQRAEIPRLAFGDLNFSLDIKDTGNTHFFVYASGELEGVSSRGKGPEATHLLMPDTTRTIGSTIPAPLLPGIYKAVYGYKSDSGESVTRTTHIVYIPPWSLVATVGVIWFVVVLVRRRLRVTRHDRIRHS